MSMSNASSPKRTRRRVLKAARLIFNKRQSTIDCMVRELGDTGAEVEMPSTLGIPDDVVFVLRSAQGGERLARVVSRRPTRLELVFVEDAVT